MALTLACGRDAAPPQARLLLLLTVDTLRADRLAAHGGDAGLTPTLDALAAESVVFKQAYAPVPHTLPSITSLLTGRYPQELGVTGNLSRLPAETETLASRFRNAGWKTAAVVSNWVLRRAVGTDQGFDHFDDRLTRREAARPMPEREGFETTAAALEAADSCLSAERDRCFLWVHYQDPHGPYTPPPARLRQRLAIEQAAPGGDRELPVLQGSFGTGGIPDYQRIEHQRSVAFYRAAYDAEIMHLDAAVADLLSGLGERVPRDATAIVFAADHGEALGEGDYWFGHGETLSEEQIHVPLWFAFPHETPGAREDLASLIDVMPTLADRLLPAGTGSRKEQTSTGRPLLRPGARDEFSTIYLATLQGSDEPRIGVIDPSFKYVANLRDESEWDGRLTRLGDDSLDLTAPAPQVAARMRARLEELLRAHREAPGEELELDSADRERLRALGYLREGDR